MQEMDTESAAKNSVFMDPEVISKLVTLLKDGTSDSVNPLSSRLLESSISRGFMNMLSTLKLDYVSLLKEKDLFNKLTSYFVLVAGASSAKFDEMSLRNVIQKDMHIVSKSQKWTNDRGTMNHTCSIVTYEDEDHKQAIFSIPSYDYSGKKLK
jgi:hypothetical protein